MDRVRKGAGEGDISRRGVRVTARANKVDLAKIDKKGHVFFFLSRRQVETNNEKKSRQSSLCDWLSHPRVLRLVSLLLYSAQSTTRHYIRAEGDFHKDIYK